MYEEQLMNHLVRQLAEQADLGWAIKRANIQGDTRDLKALEQFADLIILECLKAVDSGPTDEAGDLIIEHFGLR